MGEALKFPKPVKRAKVRKPRKPLRAKRWGVSKSKRGTKHSRRAREFGRMHYARSGGCDVGRAFSEMFWTVGLRMDVTDPPGPCEGPVQYMHLHIGKTAGRRRAPDHQGAAGCEKHHQDIDGKIGGKGEWYVALGYDGQQALKQILVRHQRERWDKLPTRDKAWCDYMAAGAP